MEEADYSIKGIEMKKANNNFESGHGKIGRVGIKFMLKKAIGKALEGGSLRPGGFFS